jgi:hypothetical protein
MYRERPVLRTRIQPYVARRHRRWEKVSWWYSLTFVAAIVLIGITALYGALTGGDDAKTMVLKVTDAATGKALAGAQVVAGDQTVTSNDKGEVRIKLPAQPVSITVQRADYRPVYGEINQKTGASQSVALPPSTITGTIKDKESGAAIKGASVIAVTGAGPVGQATQSRNDGSFTLQNVPADARVRIDAGDYGVRDFPIDDKTHLSVVLQLTQVSGKITGADGKPVAGASVSSGDKRAQTNEQGDFKLTGIGAGAQLTVEAPGFAQQQVSAPDSGDVAITLQAAPTAAVAVGGEASGDHMAPPETVKAIYVTAQTAAVPADLDKLIQLVDDTELNAVVVDIKEDWVFYDTQVKFFQDAGSVKPLYDPTEVIKKLHEHNIYTIARLVVFKDPIVAENRPDLAVKDENTGDPWRDNNDVAWVNPTRHELWQANIDLAVEAASLGFDEIQYDYIRFPSDGDLSTADFGFDYGSEDARVKTIVDFLKESQRALKPTGAKFGIDVFGIVAIYPDDQGIGQRLADLAPYVDYVCPMLYPSHFDPTSIDVGGVPNDHPKATIDLGLRLAKDKMPGMEKKLRPWLQDFSLPGMTPYGADQVRAQIDAAEESGASGWMIWNAGNEYTDGAFKET